MLRFFTYVGMGVMLMSASCTQKTSEKEAETTFAVTSPFKKDTVITKEYVAQIKSVKNIEIRAQEKGFLQKVFVDEGQYVHQGQMLFQIMPQIYEAELLKAKAEVEQAGIELQNASTLAKNNVVSPSERSMAQAKRNAAAAEMRLAQLHLSFTSIKAPFSGYIDRLPLKIGSLVDEGALLTTLSDNSGVYAYFNVSEPEYINYQTNIAERQNQELTLIMANGQPMPQKGTIKNIEGEFDNETGNISFRGIFPNPNQILRNGETGKVQMTVPMRNALMIPQKSTYEIQDQKYVFVIDKKGIAKSRNIKAAYELPDVYVVQSGLEEGDEILVDGTQKVKDGQQLKTKYVDPVKLIYDLKYSAN